MRKIKLNIGNKIFGGFLILIILFAVNASIIFFNSNKIDQVVSQSQDIVRPSDDAINDLILLVTRSEKLAINWVYVQVQSDTEDKKALKDLHNIEWPALKSNIDKYKELWENKDQIKLMDSVIDEFEAVLKVQQEIMNQLAAFENYEDPLTKLLADDAIESQVIPMTASITTKLQGATEKKEEEEKKGVAQMQQEINEKSDQDLQLAAKQLRNITIILGVIIVAIGLLSAYFMARSITLPINYIKDIVVKLGKGELVEDQGRSFNNDEIGEMAKAMETFIQGLQATTFFAENIGKGSYDSEFQPLSENDVLGNALIEMRNNLQRVAEDDKKRNWSTEGLAKFGDILRRNNDNLELLADDIIRNLVKYLGSNQGGLYIIDDVEQSDPFMTLMACYAWDKKKYVDQKVHRGEGLAGQVWQEMDTIYLTEVPDDYIRITSGLGDSNPKSVLIVPLKVNEEIYGVVEVASFRSFEQHEVEFVEKIAESIASTVSSVKINAKTQKLLQESQQMTEQMRSQEEEMRQNMEELQATQEEMQRGQAEAENTMDAINQAIATVEFDLEGKILNVNQNFLDLMGYSKDEMIGENHRALVSKEEKTSDNYKQLWRDLVSGMSKQGEFRRIAKGGDIKFMQESYSPIRGRDGAVAKILLFATDVTEYKEVQA